MPMRSPRGKGARMPHTTHADEVFARRAVRLADPLDHAAPPPLQATGAQLRERAETRARRRRWLARAPVAAVNVAAVTAGVCLANPAHAAPAPLAMDRSGAAPAAAQWLRDTATRLAAAPAAADPASTPDGQVFYTHLQRWSMDTTGHT